MRGKGIVRYPGTGFRSALKADASPGAGRWIGGTSAKRRRKPFNGSPASKALKTTSLYKAISCRATCSRNPSGISSACTTGCRPDSGGRIRQPRHSQRRSTLLVCAGRSEPRRLVSPGRDACRQSVGDPLCNLEKCNLENRKGQPQSPGELNDDAWSVSNDAKRYQ